MSSKENLPHNNKLLILCAVALRPDIDANDSTNFDTIKGGESDHTYSKNPDELSDAIPPAGKEKNHRQDIGLPVKFDLNRHLNADSHFTPSIIHTPQFPYVFIPYPLESVCIVELDSNGDPVVDKPVIVQPSARSVLECVENRVAGKNASTEQKEPLPNDSIENLENVEESIHEISSKKITRILGKQRKERKYRAKPNFYSCEICQKGFTRVHSLNYHMMVHGNEFRFECGKCHRLFRHPSHYKSHIKRNGNCSKRSIKNI